MLVALLFLMQAMVEPSPPDHHVFDNDEAGGRAFEGAMYCLANAATKSGRSPTSAMVIEIHRTCTAQTDRLRKELIRIFADHPARAPSGMSPEEAADQFVINLLNRIDYVLIRAAPIEK